MLDILRVSAPIIMIALGMTFVIATGGIDLSVGSMMAVGGAVAMQTLCDAERPDIGRRDVRGDRAGARCSAIVLGAINGLLVAVVGLQPFITTLIMMLAARGIARVITGGQNTNATNEPFRLLANGQILGLPTSFVLAVADRRPHRLVDAPHGARPHDRVDRHQPAREPARRHPSPSHPDRPSTSLARAPRRHRAASFSVSEVMTVSVVGHREPAWSWTRSSRSSSAARRSPAASSRSCGSTIGALLIATLNKTVLFLGIPAAATPAFKALVIIVARAAAVRADPLVRLPPASQAPRLAARRPRSARRSTAKEASHERLRTLAEAVPARDCRRPATRSARTRWLGCGSATSR